MASSSSSGYLLNEARVTGQPHATGVSRPQFAATDGMPELLARAGHRCRVRRLIELGGNRPPRRGPRMPVRDYRAP